MALEIRSWSNPSVRTTVEFKEPSRTKQEFARDCDINVIMRKYQSTQMLPVGVGTGVYGDFSSDSDFRQAQDVLLRARSQFESLPSRVRDRFANSPELFLAFVGDKANQAEARKLGLLMDEKPPAVPMEVRIVGQDNVPVAPAVSTPVSPVAK